LSTTVFRFPRLADSKLLRSDQGIVANHRELGESLTERCIGFKRIFSKLLQTLEQG
jgi:hypothetical protein